MKALQIGLGAKGQAKAGNQGKSAAGACAISKTICNRGNAVHAAPVKARGEQEIRKKENRERNVATNREGKKGPGGRGVQGEDLQRFGAGATNYYRCGSLSTKKKREERTGPRKNRGTRRLREWLLTDW